MSKEVIDRILSRVVKGESGCWNSQWCRTNRGYTEVSIQGERYYTHRAMYELLVGPIPNGLHIDHKCSNRLCCNPDHLEPVTPAENNRRANERSPNGHVRRQTQCIRGHELPPPGSTGRRNCLKCRKLLHESR